MVTDTNAIRRILAGSTSFLIDDWNIGSHSLKIRGWFLSGYESASVYSFKVNGRKPEFQNLGLSSPSLAKVFPFFSESAEKGGFELEICLSAEDFEKGYIEVSLVDAMFNEPVNQWHTTYIPCNIENLKIPDATQLQRTQGNISEARYLCYGLTTAKKIERLLQIYFRIPIASLTKILDFGVGCGRVAQHIFAKNPNLIGCDIDSANVMWCAENLPGKYFVNNLQPPLEIPSGSVDLVYGISIFTHLDGDSAKVWRDELFRIVSPGGIVLLTTHGCTGIARILDDNRLHQIALEGFDSGTIDHRLDDYIDNNRNYYRATYQAPENVRKFFGENFEVVDLISGGNALLQDFVVLHKPSVESLIPNEISKLDETNLRELAKFSGDPWQPSNKYFDVAEVEFDVMWTKKIMPFIDDCDFTSTVDLACGKGRNSSKLVSISSSLFIMDINSALVEYCKHRFSEIESCKFAVGNGYDFHPIPDNWATFVYCFDAMVHFDSDVVRNYIKDLKRVLAKNGKAFFHHSNLSTHGADWTKNPKARNFMSTDLFRHYCEKEGLVVLKQQIIDWGDAKEIDCFSLIENK
jgi:SAM-dependent methyltransferase